MLQVLCNNHNAFHLFLLIFLRPFPSLKLVNVFEDVYGNDVFLLQLYKFAHLLKFDDEDHLLRIVPHIDFYGLKIGFNKFNLSKT